LTGGRAGGLEVRRLESLNDAVAQIRGQRPHAWLKRVDEFRLVGCDFLQTQQVLYNLLDNARKYVPNLPCLVAAEDQGDFVMISVHDQAPGVAENERDKVFARFYRAKNSPAESGSGSGLSICQGLIEAQGGRIRIDPGVVGGAKSCCSLPVARP
jgi:two-component system sensor histidine kinase KdpD